MLFMKYTSHVIGS
uniref:Uncharacterized protein n=1 Tax=Anguilla anguilla TaxID=7936 RepID=A0A0E9XVK1_ANGAN